MELEADRSFVGNESAMIYHEPAVAISRCHILKLRSSYRSWQPADLVVLVQSRSTGDTETIGHRQAHKRMCDDEDHFMARLCIPLSSDAAQS